MTWLRIFEQISEWTSAVTIYFENPSFLNITITHNAKTEFMGLPRFFLVLWIVLRDAPTIIYPKTIFLKSKCKKTTLLKMFHWTLKIFNFIALPKDFILVSLLFVEYNRWLILSFSFTLPRQQYGVFKCNWLRRSHRVNEKMSVINCKRFEGKRMK